MCICSEGAHGRRNSFHGEKWLVGPKAVKRVGQLEQDVWGIGEEVGKGFREVGRGLTRHGKTFGLYSKYGGKF